MRLSIADHRFQLSLMILPRCASSITFTLDCVRRQLVLKLLAVSMSFGIRITLGRRR